MRIVVRVSPKAPATRVGGRYGDSEPPVLIIRVTAPAVDGKANAATIEALAQALDLPRRSVQIVAGEHARTKVLEVKAADPAAIAALLLKY
jgi:uncharacterized protein